MDEMNSTSNTASVVNYNNDDTNRLSNNISDTTLHDSRRKCAINKDDNNSDNNNNDNNLIPSSPQQDHLPIESPLSKRNKIQPKIGETVISSSSSATSADEQQQDPYYHPQYQTQYYPPAPPPPIACGNGSVDSTITTTTVGSTTNQLPRRNSFSSLSCSSSSTLTSVGSGSIGIIGAAAGGGGVVGGGRGAPRINVQSKRQQQHSSSPSRTSGSTSSLSSRLPVVPPKRRSSTSRLENIATMLTTSAGVVPIDEPEAGNTMNMLHSSYSSSACCSNITAATEMITESGTSSTVERIVELDDDDEDGSEDSHVMKDKRQDPDDNDYEDDDDDNDVKSLNHPEDEGERNSRVRSPSSRSSKRSSTPAPTSISQSKVAFVPSSIVTRTTTSSSTGSNDAIMADGGGNGDGGNGGGAMYPDNDMDGIPDPSSTHQDPMSPSGIEQNEQSEQAGRGPNQREDDDDDFDLLENVPPQDPALELKDELYKYMREEPGMFDWIQEALGDGVWYYDMANTEWYSPAFKELFGYTDEEIPNTPAWWQENIFPEDLQPTLEAFQQHIANGIPFDKVIRYRHKTGSTVWVRCHGKAIFNDDGIPIRMLGAHNDLTPLMQVQEKLKEKEEVLDLLCTTSLDGYWDWNVTTGDLVLSTRFKNLLGYEEDDLPNRIETWWSLLHPDDVPKLEDAIEKCKMETTNNDNAAAAAAAATTTVTTTSTATKEAKPPLLNIVLRYRRKNGTIARLLAQGVAQFVPISTCSTPTGSSSETPQPTKQWVRMFGTHTDVSYLEEARLARDANAAKTTFLATMSHEIRTPLNAVLGMAQVLTTTSLTEEQKDCVTTLHNSGAHLLSLINDILDFSQIEAGMIGLTLEDVDIQRIIRNVLDVLHHSAQQNSVLLTYETSIPAGTHFRGDPERIRQICFNLIGNAVKFTKKGIVSVRVRSHRDGVEISIQDTGCGIEHDQMEHIFDDFRQASHEIRSKYGGSGLGLSICKRLIQAIGGTVHVQSTLGVGSTFTVWLPGLQQDSDNSDDEQQQSGSDKAIEEVDSGIYVPVYDPILRTNPDSDLTIPHQTNSTPTSNSAATTAIANIVLPPPPLPSPSFLPLRARANSLLLDQLNPAVQPVVVDVTDVKGKEPKCINHEVIDASQNISTASTNPIDTSTATLTISKKKKLIVYLYEELDCNRGSIQSGLAAAGLAVQRITRATNVAQLLRSLYTTNPTSVVRIVIHHQQKKVSLVCQKFIMELLSLLSSQYQQQQQNGSIPHDVVLDPIPPVHLFDVGRKVSSIVPDQYKFIYTSLPIFPTSDEFYDELKVGTSIPSKSSFTDFVQGSDHSMNDTKNDSSNGERKAPMDHPNESYSMKQKSSKTPSSRSFIEKSTSTNIPSTSNHTCGSNSSNIISTSGGCVSDEKILNILVAEDNLINQKVMKRLLSRFSCRMEIANNGLEAVERAKSESWDLIFMDLIMPEMDGMEAVKVIRQLDTVTPIVALTANATTGDRDDCFEVGMNDFLTKPVSMEALRKLIQKVRCGIPLSNSLS